MQRFIAWADAHRDDCFDVIRIYLGLALFARGLLLITNTPTTFVVDLMQRAGQSWITSGILLHYVTLAHLIGGALLIVGLLTRVAAWVQVPILVGAVFVIHRPDGLFALGQSLELSALVLFLLVVIGFAGAGRLSLDHVVFGARSRRQPEIPLASQH